MDYRALALIPIAALVLSVSAASPRLPEGWLVNSVSSGETPGADSAFDISLLPASDAGATPTLTIRSTRPLRMDMPQLGALTQHAYGYASQRVRFSAEMRAQGAKAWAGLYMTPGNGNVLGRAAMGAPGIEDRLPPGAPVTADDQWQAVSVVMDVPADAPMLSVGMALVGEGQLWARRLHFEVVGPEVPVTRSTIAIDWAQARQTLAASQRTLAKLPPQALANARLD